MAESGLTDHGNRDGLLRAISIRSRFAGLRGPAGSGKTFSIGAKVSLLHPQNKHRGEGRGSSRSLHRVLVRRLEIEYLAHVSLIHLNQDGILESIER